MKTQTESSSVTGGDEVFKSENYHNIDQYTIPRCYTPDGRHIWKFNVGEGVGQFRCEFCDFVG